MDVDFIIYRRTHMFFEFLHATSVHKYCYWPCGNCILMLVKMVKVQKTYKVHFVVEFSDLGESDPLLQNVRSLQTVLKM